MNIKKESKQNGNTIYKTNIYLGLDSLTGKQVRTNVTGKTKREVENKALQIRQDFEKNGNTTKKEMKHHSTFEEIAKIWFDDYKRTKKANSSQQMESQLNRYILPVFKDYRIDKISSKFIQETVIEWTKRAEKGGMMKNIKLLVNILDRIFRLALVLNEVKNNPTANILVPKVSNTKKKEIKHLNGDELARFLTVLEMDSISYQDTVLKTLCQFLVASGLRVSEALSLEWSDFDFKNSSVSISKTLDRTGQKSPTPKTNCSNRVVTLDSETIQLLNHWKVYQSTQLLSHGLRTKIVFCREDLQYYQRSFLGKHLKVLFARANVSDIGFHGLRHTHASLLLNNGVGYKEISERLGHSKISTTIDTYSHLEEKNKQKTADTFLKIKQDLIEKNVPIANTETEVSNVLFLNNFINSVCK